MKREYMKPMLEIVELRPEEMMANPSCGYSFTRRLSWRKGCGIHWKRRS